MSLEPKPLVVMRALLEADQTVDEFVSKRGWYVNSWAPVFTQLRRAGLLERTGEKRETTHGSEACVLTVTDSGLMWLDAVRPK